VLPLSGLREFESNRPNISRGIAHGTMTETSQRAEKRQLDFFRMQDKHPAATYDSLPQEVQSYIGGLELEAWRMGT
jgi:hypothetical protein